MYRIAPRAWEQHLNHCPFRWAQGHAVRPRFSFVCAAVGADKLCLRAAYREPERPGVRGIRDVETDDLSPIRLERVVLFSVHEEDVPVTAHEGAVGAVFIQTDLTFLNEDVVKKEWYLAVHGIPIRLVGRHHQEVAVQTQFLLVILPDMRVIPIYARVRELQLIHKGFAWLHFFLRRLRAVKGIVHPDAVRMQQGLHIGGVREVHGDFRTLRNLDGRPRNRAVVRKHAVGLTADLLLRETGNEVV